MVSKEKMRMYTLILLLITVGYAILNVSAQVIEKNEHRKDWIERRLLH